METLSPLVWLLLVLLLLLAAGLMWWNRKQMQRPRRRWDRFVRGLRRATEARDRRREE